MSDWLLLAGFLVLVVGGGLLSGLLALPGPWYEGLNKPFFTPPNWLFAPAWTLLYVLIAVAGWRTWRRERTGTAMRLWWGQLAVNFLWSPVFFNLQRVDLALVVALAMLGCILAFLRTVWPEDRKTAFLFIPYALWVGFASVLNAAVWVLN